MLGVSAQRFLEYRSDFLMWSSVSIAWTLFMLLFYEILFLQSPTIAGWTRQQMYLFIGTYMIVDSTIWGLFWRNIQSYVEAIFQGTLDFLLVQPLDPQFRLSTRHISFTNIPRLLIGVGIIVIYLPTQITMTQIVVYTGLVMLGALLIYLLWFLVATFTFWVDKLDNIVEIVPTLRRIWSVPADVYSGPLSMIFTLVVPLALITTTPARVLFQVFRLDEIAILGVFTLGVFALTRWFFWISLKRYSSVGS